MKILGGMGSMNSSSWLDFGGDPEQDVEHRNFRGIFIVAG